MEAEQRKRLHELLDKMIDRETVAYCRAKPADDGTPSLLESSGKIDGIIIGATRRIQTLVIDDAQDTSKAWTLDVLCIDPSVDTAARYFEHHKNLKAIVEEHNQLQKDRETAKIKEVDDINSNFFGEAVVG